MEALVGTLIAVVIVQFSLLWYRIGRVEQKVKDITNNLKGGKDG